MKSKILFFGLVLCIGLSSCVPHKDLVYLQNKENALDSLASNNLTEIQKPYRIQVNDILNIRVKALDQDKVSDLQPCR